MKHLFQAYETPASRQEPLETSFRFSGKCNQRLSGMRQMKFLGQEIPLSGFQTKYQDKDGREGHT